MSITDQFQVAQHGFPGIPLQVSKIGDPQTILGQNPGYEGPDNRAVSPTAGSLLLGTTEDGWPVMLDLYDPAPGPLLVAGDGGCGKTALIKSLARSSDAQSPGEIQFGVITPFPEEWKEEEAQPNCLGAWPAYHAATKGFLLRLIYWADALAKSRQRVLLLVDGLDLLTACDFKIQPELSWLLIHGPEQHIWPVVTVNPGRLPHMETWLRYFQTRILGQLKHSGTNRLFSNEQEFNPGGLEAGAQFILSAPGGRLKFRMMSADHGDRDEDWNALVR